MSESFYYTFPAIRGIQAGKEYYASMCPLKLVPKIFIYDEEELNSEMRVQRVLNKARIPEISTYIVENPKSYIFSSLTASIDGDVEFTPISSDPTYYNIGSLRVPMTAKFVINDGQHRRAAIENALKKMPQLGDETISIVFFIDLGLKCSQQMFTDLNRYAIRTTKSLNILYDNRDPFSIMIKDIISKVEIFNGLVETEKSTISNRSTKIFTLSGIYHATTELLKNKQDLDINTQKEIAVEFWSKVSENINEWQMVRKKQLSAAELRRDYINAHSIALAALGRAGYSLLEYSSNEWYEHLKKLQAINWHRENSSVWEGRITIGGKISGSRNNTVLVTNYIKNVLGIPLTEEENIFEKAYDAKEGKHE